MMGYSYGVHLAVPPQRRAPLFGRTPGGTGKMRHSCDGNVVSRSWLDGGGRWDYCLMIDVRVLLVQFFGQSLSLFLCEADRSGSDPSAECGLPVDGVGLFATLGFHRCLGTN